MENFQSINKRVNLAHESFHKDDLAEADAHVTELGRESLMNVKSRIRILKFLLMYLNGKST